MSSRLLFSLFSLCLLMFSSLALSQEETVQDETVQDDPSQNEMAQEDMSEPAQEGSNANKMVSIRYLCELEGLTRRVEIDYESADAAVPCSVNYFKDSEAPGEVNTLWNATNIEGYCEEKAAGFVDKLKSWGWSCTGT